jgi:hypothetical protein
MRARIALALLAAVASLRAAAQDAGATSLAHDAFQLSATTRELSRAVIVDSTRSISLQVVSLSRSLTVKLVSPSGASYTFGVPGMPRFTSLVRPVEPQGASYAGTVTEPERGEWRLVVREGSPGPKPVDVLATTYISNTTRLVFAGGGTYPLGARVRLALVAFDRKEKVKGLASITARLFRPGDPAFAPAAVTFRDDGKSGDEKADDGIYEAIVSPSAAGVYQVQAEVLGRASTGGFRRSAAATLTFTQRFVELEGFSDRGWDDDGDLFFDRLIVFAKARVQTAGTYKVAVTLRDADGHLLESAARQTLQPGAGGVDVSFRAEDITARMHDGRFVVAQVRWFRETAGDVALVASRSELGTTGRYFLDDFDHPDLRLLPQLTIFNHSENARGEYRSLDVELFVDAELADSSTFTYAAALVDRNGRELDFYTSTVELQDGRNGLELHFNGEKIGRNAVDGPYFVVNLTLFNDFSSLIVPAVATTPPYKAHIFEGYPIPRRRSVRH